jgi:hypothetical protein
MLRSCGLCIDACDGVMACVDRPDRLRHRCGGGRPQGRPSLIGLAAFAWTIKSDQYDDPAGDAARILDP